MAPNHAIDTRYGREAQLETFLMSNICPQRPNLNRRVWEKLEGKVADDYANRLPNVWVTSGPIFGANVERLPCGVEIPDAFYSIVVAGPHGRPSALAFIVPQTVNGTESLPQFLRSIDKIEQETGLNFLAGLQDNVERALEQDPAPAMW
jgi:endonuclease G